MDIDLLLADANGEPVLAKGLPYGAAAVSARAEEPEPEQFGLLDYRQDDKDPNDLVRQRWGVIVPAGTDGKRLAEAIAPLRAARKEEQNGNEPIVFEAPAGMSAEEAGIWWGTVYNSKDVEAVDRPRYLLILGDADQISWESQQRWASSAFVGRLAFANDAGYESYVHKILACERASRAGFKKPRAAFHTVKDGTAATATGHRGLMSPTIDAAQVGLKKNDFPASAIVDLNEEGVASPDDFMRAVALHDPTLLFSISHGLGSTAETPKDEQRRMQGAMSFGRGVKLTAEDVANKPFLPGGAWFFFACFSAGTPSHSAYQHWLASLKEAGMNIPQSQIDAVLAALARESSFVAALPQALLANPDGPLAVMGHVDLAWTFSFQDLGNTRSFKPARFENVFRGIVDHSRIGGSFFDLQRYFIDANTDLTDMLDKEERARRRNEPLADEKTRPLKKGALWMLRQDLTAYVLLGDPAARVTASASPEEVRKVPSIVTSNVDTAPSADTAMTTNAAADGAKAFGDGAQSATNALTAMDPARIEAAVFAAVGNEAMDAIAKHFGATRAELDAWVNAYKEGGRAAVRGKPGA